MTWRPNRSRLKRPVLSLPDAVPRGHRQDQVGFTLIEILVAMLVFLTGVAGIYALLSTGLSMQQDSLRMSRAGRHMEEVVQLLQRQVSDGTLDADVPLGKLSDGTCYRVSLLGSESVGDEDARLVEIRVAATERGLVNAEPYTHLLGPGPSMARAIEEWRAQRVSEASSRSTLEGR